MGDQFEPAPAVLVVSEAVIALPLHNSGTLLVNKPRGRKNAITQLSPAIILMSGVAHDGGILQS